MRVAVSRDVARLRFSAFVRDALSRARSRGMTDNDIAAATKVGDSTFHRWAKGDWTRTPQLDKVVSFCNGLGESTERALGALGVIGAAPEPEAPMDPDVVRILRRLNDPNVPETEKSAMRGVIRLLAGRGNLAEGTPDRATG
jgi:transcriptional regulator with XRE-family HTH domain